MYAFSKGARFPEKKGLNGNVAYEQKSQFNTMSVGGSGRPFY